MSEHRLWNYIRAGMRPHWAAQRIEDRLTPGVPDICYALDGFGWLELKYLAQPPKREGTPLSIPHLTPEQRNWASTFGPKTGRVFMLLQVGDSYLLFGHESIRKIGVVTWPEHIAMARAHWVKKINWKILAGLLGAPSHCATAASTTHHAPSQ